MGWFSKKSKKPSTPQPQSQAQPQPPRPSFTDPPNVFASRPPIVKNDPNRLQRRPQSAHAYTQPPPPPPPQQQQQQQRLPPQRPSQQSRPPITNVSRPNPNLPYANQYASHSQPQLHPPGFLPPPPGWNPGPAPAYHHPVIVNQHYYLQPPQQQQQQQQQLTSPPPLQHQQHHQMSPGPSQPPQRHAPPPPPPPHFLQPPQPPQPPPQELPVYSESHSTTLGRFAGSMLNLSKDFIPFAPGIYDDGLSAWHGATGTASNLTEQTQLLYDDIYARFNNVMTLIDHEKRHGNENDLFDCQIDAADSDFGASSQARPASPHVHFNLPQDGDRGVVFPRPILKNGKKGVKRKKSQGSCVASSVVGGISFSKVELYGNSKLPRELPSLALYVNTWPLLCLAAQYSQRVYEKPTGAELDAHVSGDWLTGTKAMCIKSVPMDHMNAIVFAIRGSASFADWAVNLNDAPVSPRGFLDDAGNSCHAGFLSVAKKMIKPVAARLRQLLREDPSRSRYSLLITGHSAGGAVAALLYSHMLAETKDAESELNVLTSCFKRIHCITFGAPPLSLLPLTKPDHPHLRKSLFLSFINEGDPVVRADKAYVRSLLELLATPPPILLSKHKDQRNGRSRSKPKTKSRSRSSSAARKPEWKVPPSTLSNAGRLIVLRTGDPKAKPKERKAVHERLNEGVRAVTCHEDQLRGVIWGDPVCHLMSLYAGRVEVLAVGAVTAKR